LCEGWRRAELLWRARCGPDLGQAGLDLSAAAQRCPLRGYGHLETAVVAQGCGVAGWWAAGWWWRAPSIGWDGADCRATVRQRRPRRRDCGLDLGQTGLEPAVLHGPCRDQALLAGMCLSCPWPSGCRALPFRRVDLLGLLGHGSPRVGGSRFRDKSLLARAASTRRRLWVSSFLLEGRRGYPCSTSP
jgi:hypothetical protein